MIELPLMACSVNKYYRSWQGRVLISKDGREFKKEVDLLLNNYEKILGKIKLTLILYFKDKRKRDLDNYNKVLIDCLKNRLFEDDDQIYQLYMEKHIGCGFNKICIIVDPIEETTIDQKIIEEADNKENNESTIENVEKKPRKKRTKILKKTIIDMC